LVLNPERYVFHFSITTGLLKNQMILVVWFLGLIIIITV